MKKCVLLSLLACVFSAYAMAEDGDDGTAVTTTTETKDYSLHVDTYPWNYSATCHGKIAITFTSQWGAFKLTEDDTVDTSEYVGYKIVVSEVQDAHMNIGNAENSWLYPSLVVGTNEYTFDTEFGDITTFEIQGTEAGGYITVDEAYLVKKDGTEDEMLYGGPSWGCEFDAYEPAYITYTGQYGGVYINDPETDEPAAFTYGNGETQDYTVTFSQPTADALTLEYDNGGNGFAWATIDKGSTEYTFTISDEKVSKDVEYIYIKASSDNDADSNDDGSVDCYGTPFTIYFSSITAEITTVSTDEGDDGDGEDGNEGDDGGDGEDTVQLIIASDGGDYLNMGVDTSIWGTDDSITVDTDAVPNTAEMTFKGTWSGTGWVYWSNNLDITSYKEIVVEYTIDDENSTAGAYIQLYLSDSNGYTVSQADQDRSGVISFILADNLTTTNSSDETVNFDYSAVTSLMIQNSNPLSVKIDAVYFLTEEVVYDHNLPLDGTGTANGGWSVDYDTSTHTITLTDSYGAYSWWFGDQNDSEYAGVQIVFTTTEESSVNLHVSYTDSNSGDASVTGSGDGSVEQVLYLPLNPDYSNDVSQLWIQGTTEGATIKLISAKFVAEQADMSLSVTTDEGYSTYYSGTAWIMPDGLEGVTFNGAQSGTLSEGTTYKAGYLVPAGTALLVKGEGSSAGVSYSSYNVEEGDYESASPEDNLLYGSDTEVTTYALVNGVETTDGYYFYMLSYDANDENLGFYWGTSEQTNGVEGGPFTSKQNKAWLALPSDGDGAKLSAFVLGDGGSTTGITEVETVPAVSGGAVYNIQGVRVNDTSRKGVYIVDGKKYIKK